MVCKLPTFLTKPFALLSKGCKKISFLRKFFIHALSWHVLPTAAVDCLTHGGGLRLSPETIVRIDQLQLQQQSFHGKSSGFGVPVRVAGTEIAPSQNTGWTLIFTRHSSTTMEKTNLSFTSKHWIYTLENNTGWPMSNWFTIAMYIKNQLMDWIVDDNLCFESKLNDKWTKTEKLVTLAELFMADWTQTSIESHRRFVFCDEQILPLHCVPHEKRE